MKLEVRKAYTEDKEFVQNSIVCLLSELRNCEVKKGDNFSDDSFENMICDDDNYALFIATDGEKKLGIIALSVVSALHCGRYAIIEELWVSQEYRNMGVGKMLIDAVEKYCNEKGINRIDVGLPHSSFKDIDSTNSFYTKCGFESVGIRKKKVVR